MKLTEAEWQIMNTLWKDWPATARQIADRLPKEVNWAYTTIKTMLTRLAEKNAVRETKKGNIAEKVDLMIIVGGKNSSNTNQLVKLSKSVCAIVHHIETADEIKDEWFNKVETIGITGGASTPQRIIDEVEKKIREISIRREYNT